jgi:hypothetical protein
MIRRLLRTLTFPLVVLAALLFWLEEWLWEPLAALMQRLGRLPLLRRLEQALVTAPPYLALASFLIPMLVLLPFKLLGLWLLGHGKTLAGFAVFLSAKVVGTAIGARILALTKPKLLSLGWFARLWHGFMRLRDYLYHRITALAAWQWLQAWRREFRSTRMSLLARLRRRWAAIRKTRN